MYGSIADMVVHVAGRFGDAQLEFVDRREKLPYRRLMEHVGRVARAAARRGWSRREVVAIVLPTSPEFYISLLGLQCAGICPSPMAPPRVGRALTNDLSNLRRLVTGAGIRRAIVHESLLEASAGLREALPELELVSARTLVMESAGMLPRIEIDPHTDLALVQFTSGSTSSPKGVALTHAQLLSGVDAIAKGIELTERDVNGQWLPVHHDMGLIGSLTGIACGVSQHLWSPMKFVRDPLAWLHAFGQRKATICACPNFAYAALIDRAQNANLANLHLDSWRVAFNGAEPIDAAVMERFCEVFGPAGFRREAMFPVYGMAETTLATTFPPVNRAPRAYGPVDPGRLGVGDRVAAGSSAAARTLVSVGRAVRGHAIRVTLDGGGIAEPLQVGEIEARGPAVMAGYYRNPDATRSALVDGWLRTGDLGFVDGHGDLYVTGRRKEMMIINGRNYFPQDVEQTILGMPQVSSRTVAVFADQRDDGDRMVAVVETALRHGSQAEPLLREMQRYVAATTGVTRLDLVLVQRGTIPKTTSGKLRRLHLRHLLEGGALGPRVLARMVAGKTTHGSLEVRVHT